MNPLSPIKYAAPFLLLAPAAVLFYALGWLSVNDTLLAISASGLLFLLFWRINEAFAERPRPCVERAPNLQLMLDLETFGVNPGCKVRSIAMVAFDVKSGAIVERLYYAIRIEDQPGLESDPDTVRWWQETVPADEQQNAFCLPVPLQFALVEVSKFYGKYGRPPVPVWALGSYFDFSILQALFRYAGVAYPIPHRLQMCMRSVNLLAGLSWPEGKTAHHALKDAERQTAVLCEALSRVYVKSNGAFKP